MCSSKFVKSILIQGSRKPSEHDRVVLVGSLYVNDNPIFIDKEFIFDLGFAEDFGVINIMDDVVFTMGFGEKCEVTLFCDQCLSESEKSSLGLTSFKGNKLADIWQMSEHEKLLLAQIMKHRGNKLMKVSNITRAYGCYKRAIKLLEGIVKENKNSDKSELLANCLANAALCLLQFTTLTFSSIDKKYKKMPSDYLIPCIRSCERAIQLKPTYSKAWFRLAKAHALLGNFDEAISAGEQCRTSFQCERSNEVEPLSDETKDQISGNFISKLEQFLKKWHELASCQAQSERIIIRNKTTQKYSAYGSDWWSDDDEEIEKLPISVWSNDLAQNMMSLHEELEAFGETMPELNSLRGKTKPRLMTIRDEESDVENE